MVQVLIPGELGRLPAYGSNAPVTGRIPMYYPTTGKISYVTPDQIASGASAVDGPASATDLAIAIYNGTTGKIIKNSVVTVSSTGVITGGLLPSTNAITAFSGGGQGSATQLTAVLNRITTCAADGDSVKLPPALAGEFIYITNTGVGYANVFPATGEVIGTLAANTAVSCPTGSVIRFSCEVAGTWTGGAVSAPAAKFTTGTTTTTFAAGQLTGAATTVYTNTQGTPGSIATRSAAQMFTDNPYARVGGTYILTVVNGQGTGTLTITAGANVTLTGTATVAINTWRSFVVTYTTAAALVIQNYAVGTFS